MTPVSKVGERYTHFCDTRYKVVSKKGVKVKKGRGEEDIKRLKFA